MKIFQKNFFFKIFFSNFSKKNFFLNIFFKFFFKIFFNFHFNFLENCVFQTFDSLRLFLNVVSLKYILINRQILTVKYANYDIQLYLTFPVGVSSSFHNFQFHIILLNKIRIIFSKSL